MDSSPAPALGTFTMDAISWQFFHPFADHRQLHQLRDGVPAAYAQWLP